MLGVVVVYGGGDRGDVLVIVLAGSVNGVGVFICCIFVVVIVFFLALVNSSAPPPPRFTPPLFLWPPCCGAYGSRLPSRHPFPRWTPVSYVYTNIIYNMNSTPRLAKYFK